MSLRQLFRWWAEGCVMTIDRPDGGQVITTFDLSGTLPAIFLEAHLTTDGPVRTSDGRGAGNTNVAVEELSLSPG